LRLWKESPHGYPPKKRRSPSRKLPAPGAKEGRKEGILRRSRHLSFLSPFRRPFPPTYLFVPSVDPFVPSFLLSGLCPSFLRSVTPPVVINQAGGGGREGCICWRRGEEREGKMEGSEGRKGRSPSRKLPAPGTGTFLLAEYCVLEYSYWLNILYWNY
jgi:hypothetical protein